MFLSKSIPLSVSPTVELRNPRVCLFDLSCEMITKNSQPAQKTSCVVMLFIKKNLNGLKRDFFFLLSEKTLEKNESIHDLRLSQFHSIKIDNSSSYLITMKKKTYLGKMTLLNPS